MRPESPWADPRCLDLLDVEKSQPVRSEWIDTFRITDRDRALAKHLARAGPATASQAAAWLAGGASDEPGRRDRERIGKLVYSGWLRRVKWLAGRGQTGSPLVGPGLLAQQNGVHVRWAWTPAVACRSVVLHQLLLRVRAAEVLWRRFTPYGAPFACLLRVRDKQVAVFVPRRDTDDRLLRDLRRCRDMDAVWILVPDVEDLRPAVDWCRAADALARAAFTIDSALWRRTLPVSEAWLIWNGETLEYGRLRALVPQAHVGAPA